VAHEFHRLKLLLGPAWRVLPVADAWMFEQALLWTVWVATFALSVGATAMKAEYAVSCLPELTIFHNSSKQVR
jgi:hypothetical protein